MREARQERVPVTHNEGNMPFEKHAINMDQRQSVKNYNHNKINNNIYYYRLSKRNRTESPPLRSGLCSS